MAVVARTPRDHVEPGRDPLRAQSVGIVVFGTWMVTGLFLDGWSHNHQKPETFFTPWHAVLYSGFGAAMLWGTLDGRRQRRAGRAPVQLGGRLTGVGLVVFGAAAVGDFAWHQAFGIERNIAALLSPTHLLLMTGGVLMVSAPLRSAWAGPGARAVTWRDFWPLLGSLTLVVAVVSFFTMYVSPFRAVVALQPTFASSGFGYIVEAAEVRLIAGVLIANVLLLGAVLFTLRRWRPPFGAFTVLFGVVGVAMSGLDSFQRLPLGLCGLIGGLVADTLLARSAPGPLDRTSVRLLSAAVPAVMWLTYFVVYKVAYDLPWTIHLWLGTAFLATLGGLGLSLLAFPPEVPDSA